MAPLTSRSPEVDEDDLRLIACLSLAPRASFALLAEVLGTSEQTIARRYRRLVAAGVLRVIGLPAGTAAPASRWMLRLGCSAAVVEDVAAALARRPDVSWVTVTAGGAEIVCNLLCPTPADRELMLLKHLPRARSITRVVPAECLHVFRPERGADWQAYGPMLTAGQQERLIADPADRNGAGLPAAGDAELRDTSPRDTSLRDRSLREEDAPMLAVLAADGRATVADLAAATGISRGRASRRLDTLVAAGLISVEVDVAYERLGFDCVAYLWLKVRPGGLDAVGRSLIENPDIPFVAAITGETNMVASVVCRSPADLYRCVTDRLGALEQVDCVEISPVIRTIKQAGAIRHGESLTLPVR